MKDSKVPHRNVATNPRVDLLGAAFPRVLHASKQAYYASTVGGISPRKVGLSKKTQTPFFHLKSVTWSCCLAGATAASSGGGSSSCCLPGRPNQVGWQSDQAFYRFPLPDHRPVARP
eukprot:3014092-Amphidinium_carterae.2